MTTLLDSPSVRRGEPFRPPDLTSRAQWHLRANAVAVGYLAASALVLVAHPWLPVPRWLAVHLLLLGAVTNAIVTWGEHFAVALLHAPPPSRRHSALRLITLNAGVVGVLAGMVADVAPLLVAGAVLVLAVGVDYVTGLLLLARRALSGRFRVVIRYYAAAGVAFLVTGALGVTLGLGTTLFGVDGDWLHLAHAHAALFGWVALTVLGTVLTLWPTVLRTQLLPVAERTAGRAWLVTTTGVGVTVAGLVTGLRLVALGGLGIFAAGVAVSGVAFVRTVLRKHPTGAAGWLLGAAMAWFAVAVGIDGWVLATHTDAGAVATAFDAVLVPLLAGFVVQILVGSLTFLLPVVLGGGPGALKAATRRLETAWRVRVVAANAAVAVLALPVGGVVRTVAWGVFVATLLAFAALAVALLLERRRRPASAPAHVAQPGTAGPGDVRSADVAAGAAGGGRRTVLVGAVVASLVAIGVPVAVAVSGDDGPAPVAVAANGLTETVDVQLLDGDIAPASITVTAGTRVVLTVTNVDTTRHDLAFPGVAATRMLAEDETEVLDLGVVGATLGGHCTVPGHARAGMVMDVLVTDADGAVAPVANDGHTDHEHGAPAADGHTDHEHGTDPGAAPAVPGGAPGPDWRPYDATLRPAPGGTEHDVTIRVEEKELEVAPGVTQTVWTFGGTLPGPTLRGKVGDVFTVTFVNDGTMGHGIDFHASMRATDDVMRVIEPGESLVYQFRAEHAGAWLYHCSAMPMLDHIANGMYGAVVIDPADLDPVDAEYVMVQGEMYLGAPGEAGDADAMRTGQYDVAAFNGYAAQYAHAPLHAHVGDRVRVWVVSAGPTKGTAFHVVGTQFDTVYKEGAYTLRRGATDGGAQALDLGPSQGGFVEFTFPEAGRYPFVDHDMLAAERGARGVFVVSDTH